MNNNVTLYTGKRTIDSALMSDVRETVKTLDFGVEKFKDLKTHNHRIQIQAIVKDSKGKDVVVWQNANPLPLESELDEHYNDVWLTQNMSLSQDKTAIHTVTQTTKTRNGQQYNVYESGEYRRNDKVTSKVYLIMKVKVVKFKTSLTSNKWLNKGKAKNSGDLVSEFCFVGVNHNDNCVFLDKITNDDKTETYVDMSENHGLVKALGENWKQILALQVSYYRDVINKYPAMRVGTIPYVEEYELRNEHHVLYGKVERITAIGMAKLARLGASLEYTGTQQKYHDLVEFYKKNRKGYVYTPRSTTIDFKSMTANEAYAAKIAENTEK